MGELKRRLQRICVDSGVESTQPHPMVWCPSCEHELTARSKGFLVCGECGRSVVTWKVLELRYFGIMTDAFRTRLVPSDRSLFCPGCKELTFEVCGDPITGVEVQRCDPCGLVSFAAGDRKVAQRGNLPEPHKSWDGTLDAPEAQRVDKGARAAVPGLVVTLLGSDPREH